MIFGFDLFRERAYGRYWISGFLANIGWMIYWVVSTWLMVEIDGRPEMVALVQTCLSIPVLFFAIPAGAVADLYGRRAVIFPSQLLVLLGFFAVAILIWIGSLTPLSILALSSVYWSGGRRYHAGYVQSLDRALVYYSHEPGTSFIRSYDA